MSTEGVLAIKALYTEQLYRADHWQEIAESALSELSAFWTGDVPDNSSLQAHILAQWGRKRLDGLREKPALLQGNS